MELILEWRDIFGVSVLVVGAAVIVGAAFGWLGERSDYCARSAYDELLAGNHVGLRRKPNQLWQLSLASVTAMAGVFLAQGLGWINIDDAPLASCRLHVAGQNWFVKKKDVYPIKETDDGKTGSNHTIAI